jgi:hypothetical protein
MIYVRNNTPRLKILTSIRDDIRTLIILSNFFKLYIVSDDFFIFGNFSPILSHSNLQLISWFSSYLSISSSSFPSCLNIVCISFFQITFLFIFKFLLKKTSDNKRISLYFSSFCSHLSSHLDRGWFPKWENDFESNSINIDYLYSKNT